MPATATLNPIHQKPDHWQVESWQVNVHTANQQKSVTQRRPYALIGSHPCCHLRVSSRKVAEVAYLTCCFGNRIETWDLSNHRAWMSEDPISEPMLEVGPCRLSFSPSDSLFPITMPKHPFRITAHLSVGNEVFERELADGVTLLSDFAKNFEPSNSAPATHAAINQGGSLWIINLAARKMRRSERICRLSMFDPTYTMGRGTITITDIDTTEGLEQSEETAPGALPNNRRRKRRKNRKSSKKNQNTRANPEYSQHCAPVELLEEQAPLFESNELLGASDELKLSKEPNQTPPATIRTPLLDGVTKVIDLLSEFTQPKTIIRGDEDHRSREESRSQESSPINHAEGSTQDVNNGLSSANGITTPLPSHHNPSRLDNTARMVANEGRSATIKANSSSRTTGVKRMPNSTHSKASEPSRAEEDEVVEKIALEAKPLPQDHWFTSFAVGEGLHDVPQTLQSKAEEKNRTDQNLTQRELTTQSLTQRSQSSAAENPQIQHKPHETNESKETLLNGATTGRHPGDFQIPCEKETQVANQGDDETSTATQAVGTTAESVGNNVSQNNMQKSHFTSKDNPVAPVGGAVVFVKDPKGHASMDDPTIPVATPKTDTQSLTKPSSDSESYTDMSSLSYFPRETEQTQQASAEVTPKAQSQKLVAAANRVLQPPPVESAHLASQGHQTGAIDTNAPSKSGKPQAFQGRVRSLSDYKIDPDELTTEISVRLANHVAPRRGFLAALRKLFLIVTIIAVHVAVIYFVGKRVYELLYVAG